jgi:hypothetical protein
MDIYWVNKAGADPVAYFEYYPGGLGSVWYKFFYIWDIDNHKV